MHDGAIGASRNSPKVRLMFNSAACALQLQYVEFFVLCVRCVCLLTSECSHLIPRVPLRHPNKFTHDVTGWMLDVNDFDFPGGLC